MKSEVVFAFIDILSPFCLIQQYIHDEQRMVVDDFFPADRDHVGNALLGRGGQIDDMVTQHFLDFGFHFHHYTLFIHFSQIHCGFPVYN
jgi:hypothetical protein